MLLSSSAALAQPGVRAVHALSGAPAIAFFVDSAVVVTDNLAEGSATPVVRVAPGDHRLTITAVGAPFEFAVVDTTIMIRADSVYTLVLSGSFDLSTTRATVLAANHPSSLDSTTTDLRFVNLALGLDIVTIDVAPNGVSSFAVTDLAYGTSSHAVNVPAADVAIRLGMGATPSFYRGRGYPTGGGTTSVLLIGRFDGSSERLLVVSLADNDTNAQTPLPQFSGLPLEEGMFRAVNVAGGLGSLDLIRDGATGDSLPVHYRFATAQRSDLLGPTRFLVTPSGAGRDQSLTEFDVAVPPDSLTTLVITMPEGASQIPVPVVLRRTLDRMPTPGHTSLQVVHVSPDLGAIDVDIVQHDTVRSTMPGLQFGAHQGYVEIPSGSWTLRLHAPGGEYRFVGGVLADASVTAIVDGSVADSSLGVDLLVETNLLEQEPMIALARVPTSEVRWSHSHRIAPTTILPNPTTGMARLAFSLDRARPIALIVYGTMGTRVCEPVMLPGQEGINMVPIDLTHLAAGAYRIVVEDPAGIRAAEGNVVIVR